MEVFTKTALDYFGKELYLMYLIASVSKFTAPDPHINTSGPKIRPEFKKFMIFTSQSRERKKLILQK